MSNSHSQISTVELKDMVKQAGGTYEGKDWSVKVYLTATGRYIARAVVGGQEGATFERDTVFDAFTDGASIVSEYYEMGVGDAS